MRDVDERLQANILGIEYLGGAHRGLGSRRELEIITVPRY